MLNQETLARTISINGKEFSVHYVYSDNKHAAGRIRDGRIMINLPKRWPQKEREDAAARLEKRIIKRMLRVGSKIHAVPQHIGSEEIGKMAKEALPGITARVNEINAAYFNAELGSIRMKKNITNWGSCSPKNNISINSALIFLGKELLDYVIVHELAHTRIRNHSKKFWHEVERVLPDYRQRKKELRKYLLTN
jgi:hypothetical protein